MKLSKTNSFLVKLNHNQVKRSRAAPGLPGRRCGGRRCSGKTVRRNNACFPKFRASGMSLRLCTFSHERCASFSPCAASCAVGGAAQRSCEKPASTLPKLRFGGTLAGACRRLDRPERSPGCAIFPDPYRLRSFIFYGFYLYNRIIVFD